MEKLNIIKSLSENGHYLQLETKLYHEKVPKIKSKIQKCLYYFHIFYISDDAQSSIAGPVSIPSPSPGNFRPPSTSGLVTSGPGSHRGSFTREPGHLTPSHFARSSSLGGHTRATSAATNPSLGQESGFQSCTSLVSLGQQQQQQQQSHFMLPQQQAKHSLFRGSPLALQRLQSDMERAESSLSGSMASLASGKVPWDCLRSLECKLTLFIRYNIDTKQS